MRLKPVLLLVSFASLSGTFAIAQQPDGGPPPMGPGQSERMDHSRGGWGQGMGPGFRIGPPGIWWHNPDLIQKLALTPDQQKHMDDILQQSRLQLVDLRANVEKQELLMGPMLAANPPDTNKVLAQIDHTAQARAELEKANAKMLLGIRNVLTPEQWTKLQAEERENRRTRMRRDGMPDGPGGPSGSGAPGRPEGISFPSNPHGQHNAEETMVNLVANANLPEIVASH
jgi:Spy/CpxP family protein refolding chaperone